MIPRQRMKEGSIRTLTTKTGRLKIHIDSVHLGIKYPCDLCEYQATEMGSLNVHIKTVHKMEKQENEM